ncbi:PIG-L family deacetylase [Pseudoclavibacter helvolus]|uniref:PIG-L family deacetylase n=1 Tax=Pseudoclavibacter helvolus TaxID=255205 RepID=UPI003C77B8A1
MIGAAAPGFTHRQEGTPEHEWRDAGIDALPPLLPGSLDEELGPGALLLVGAAHPDDECLGAGGLIATALETGARVTVLLCTLGEASHPHSGDVTPEQLGVRRRAEFDRALELLDPESERLATVDLALPDGGLSERAERIEAAARAIVREARGDRVVIAAPYRRDGHPDHEAVGGALARCARDAGALLLEFPIWFWHWARPDTDTEWRHWARLPLSARTQSRKAAAIAAHVSQLHPLSARDRDAPVLSSGHLAHFRRAAEVFRITAPATQDSDFAGAVFDGVHGDSADPWQLRSSWYERRKQALVLAMLPAERFTSTLEIGCSIGECTVALAARSDRVLAVDASRAALELAETRLAQHRNVTLTQATLPQQWDRLGEEATQFDLIVLSETGYYLAEDELCELIARSRRALTPTGVLLLCHWRGPIVGWPLDGDTVHELVAGLGMRRLSSYAQAETLVDVFQNTADGDRSSCLRRLGNVPPADMPPEAGERR